MNNQYNEDDFDESGSRKDCETIQCGMITLLAFLTIFYLAIVLISKA